MVGRIARGLVAFVGAGHDDTPDDVAYVARKIARLRVFPDERGRMARSLLDLQGEHQSAGLLAISQFTLFGDVRRGNRPGFDAAMAPELAEPLLESFYARCRAEGLRVETGRFRADMRVDVSNDGPVTILVDSKRAF